MVRFKKKNPYKGANEVRCCICGAVITDGGYNPAPIESGLSARCCKRCNEEFVIPTRARRAVEEKLTKYEREADFLKVMEIEQMFQMGRTGESVETTYLTEVGGHNYRVTKKVIRIE